MKGILSAVGMLSVVALGRVIGFVREAYIASLYGVSDVTDTFFAVQQIPLFVSNYMLGAFNIAFVPAYTRLNRLGLTSFFLKDLVRAASILGAAIVAMLLWGADDFVPEVLGLTSAPRLVGVFLRILVWSIPAYLFIGIAYSVFHAERRHMLAALVAAMPFWLMLLILFGLIAFSQAMGGAYLRVIALPLSFTFAVAILGIWSLWMILVRTRATSDSKKVRSAWLAERRLFFQQLGASSLENVAFNINQFMNVHFAATVGLGAITTNAFAFKIAVLPLSALINPLGLVFQSWLLKKDRARTNSRFLVVGVFIIIAFIGFLILLFRVPLVRLIYERGAFSGSDTVRVADLLVPYAAYFFVMASNQVLARYYFAITQGAVYSKAMIVGYMISNTLKPYLTMKMGLEGVVFSCVIGEGLALVFLTALLLRGELSR